MKHIFSTMIGIFLLGACANAQVSDRDPRTFNLTVSKTERNVIISWTGAMQQDTYWMVQAGKSEKSLTTIGYVMGPDPRKDGNSFEFKQELLQMRKGLKYFRVIEVKSDLLVATSPVVSTVK